MLRTLLGLIVVVAGCGSAHVILRTTTGGVIQLDGDQGKAMEQANQQMAQHCGPGNFTIVQEGLEPIGTDTVTSQSTASTTPMTPNGSPAPNHETTTEVTSTRTATAWRVHYQCGAGGGAIPPGPPSAGY